MQELVKLLIDKAAANLGSKANLARRLGVTPQRINDWRSGKDRCMAPDVAAMGFLAGYSAMNLIAAVAIAESEGTLRGEVLKQAFGSNVPELDRYLSANRAKKMRWAVMYPHPTKGHKKPLIRKSPFA